MNTPSNRVWLRIGSGRTLMLSMIVLVGCSAGSKKSASFSGKVTYKDQPVSGGTLTLHPADGNGQPVSTPLASDGTFLVASPPTGEMKVTIETESVRGQTGAAYKMPPGRTMAPGVKAPNVDTSKLSKYVPIPTKYAQVNTTILRCTIQPGPNVQDFPLTD